MKPPAPRSLLDFARTADPLLRALLEEKVAAARALPVDLTPAFSALRDYVLRGGKRLRGALCLLGCEAGGGPAGAAQDAALGLELLHAYLLIHDDWMDRDEERRGGPTLHLALAQPDALVARGRAAPHTAASIAVLFGSLCQAWAFDCVLRAPVAPPRALAAAQLLTRALAQVTLGQALDVAAPLSPALSADAVLELQRLKTGSYTFELPLALGAQLAGASEQTQAALAAYARPIGLAFQIADDLLGTFGAPHSTGKSAGSDLREGKRTLLVLHALAHASAAERTQLLAGLGDRSLDERAVGELRAILRRAGAEEFARSEAIRLCDEAERALESAAIPTAVASELRAIARYTIARES